MSQAPQPRAGSRLTIWLTTQADIIIFIFFPFKVTTNQAMFPSEAFMPVFIGRILSDESKVSDYIKRNVRQLVSSIEVKLSWTRPFFFIDYGNPLKLRDSLQCFNQLVECFHSLNNEQMAEKQPKALKFVGSNNLKTALSKLFLRRPSNNVQNANPKTSAHKLI